MGRDHAGMGNAGAAAYLISAAEGAALHLDRLRHRAGDFDPAVRDRLIAGAIERAARARCRSISGEMHSGFVALRSSLPMNLRARHPGFRVFNGAQGDIDRILTIVSECLSRHGGPYLFGTEPCLADAMYAPVCTRFRAYHVALPPECAAYRDMILAWTLMREWEDAAAAEPDEIEELDMEF